MEPRRVEYRSGYIGGADKQGKFSATENNTLSSLLHQPIDNVNAGTT
jgi:hypothetical protein